MSLTTHSPQEPCVGHCGACGAFADWSDIITELLDALEKQTSWAEGIIKNLEEDSPLIGPELRRKVLLSTYIIINKVIGLLPEERRE